MRASAPFTTMLLLFAAVFVAACGGPDDPDAAMTAACERQIEEIENAEEESSTPTAPSTEERLAKITLVECAGQEYTISSVEGEGDAEGEAGGDEAPEGEDAGSEGAAGEGAGGEDSGSGEAEAPAELDPAARELFASSCGSCHALADADTSGAVGPNLDETTLDAAGVADKIANGGGGMPPGLLEGDDAEAVAEYVAGAAAAE